MSATYRDLFATVATAAAALTGLLFVALSLVPRRGLGSGLSVVQQVRAAAAFLAFTNVLAVALFGLVPGTNVGYPALVLGVIGIAFTVAGIRPPQGTDVAPGSCALGPTEASAQHVTGHFGVQDHPYMSTIVVSTALATGALHPVA